MGRESNIAWTDSTVGYWEGCQQVGPGCADCYAEARDKRFYGGAHWGPGAPRRRTSEATRRHLRQWNATALFRLGRRQRVFINPHSDIFDNAVPQEWRDEVWRDIEQCHNIEPILVTKRIGNALDMVPERWQRGFPRNLILLITVVNQEEFDRDWPKLAALNCRRGLSVEPQLGRVSIGSIMPGDLHWCITGGMSRQLGEPAAYDVQWPWQLCLESRKIGAAFFMKQLGANPIRDGKPWRLHFDKKAGADMSDFPAELRVRQFPAI